MLWYCISFMLFLSIDIQSQASQPTIEKKCHEEESHRLDVLSGKEISDIKEETAKVYEKFIQPSLEVSLSPIEQDRLKLKGMYEIDQYVRQKIASIIQENIAVKTPQCDYVTAKIFQEMNFVDQKNQQALIILLDKYDIFDKEELGKEAVQQVWLLLQHADNNLPL